MSVDSARDFLTRLLTDQSFQSQILDAESPEQRAEVARKQGFHFSKAELEEAASEITESKVGDLARGDKDEKLARAAMAMLEMERGSTVSLLYGVVDTW